MTDISPVRDWLKSPSLFHRFFRHSFILNIGIWVFMLQQANTKNVFGHILLVLCAALFTTFFSYATCIIGGWAIFRRAKYKDSYELIINSTKLRLISAVLISTLVTWGIFLALPWIIESLWIALWVVGILFLGLLAFDYLAKPESISSKLAGIAAILIMLLITGGVILLMNMIESAF